MRYYALFRQTNSKIRFLLQNELEIKKKSMRYFALLDIMNKNIAQSCIY